MNLFMCICRGTKKPYYNETFVVDNKKVKEHLNRVYPGANEKVDI